MNGYDAFVSDLIPLNRSVKDIRHKDCQNLRYLEALPSVSVIFPFHDEVFLFLSRFIHLILLIDTSLLRYFDQNICFIIIAAAL